MTDPARTVADLLEVWRLVVAPSYAEPIEQADGVGMDVPVMAATQLAAADAAMLAVQQAYYLLPSSAQLGAPASGARASTGAVVLERSAPGGGELLIAAGTRIVGAITSTVGTPLALGAVLTSADAYWLPGEYGARTVPVVGEAPGAAYDWAPGTCTGFAALGRRSMPVTVLSPTTAADDLAVRGADRIGADLLGRYVLPDAPGGVPGAVPLRVVDVAVGASPADPAVVTVAASWPPGYGGAGATLRVLELGDLASVIQEEPFAGGCLATLDAIGAERLMSRASGETDPEYRQRIAALPDVVSPDAIMRICSRTIGNLGIAWRLIETGDPGTLAGLTYDGDPFSALRWDAYDVGAITDNGAVYGPPVRYFAVLVARTALDDLSFVWDATDPPSPNAWDVAGWDLRDYARGAALGSAWRAIESARAAGVAWELIQSPDL